jgi:hemerythrin-like domain-containing protein
VVCRDGIDDLIGEKTSMETIETLRNEHNGVLLVLDHLERAVRAAEGGVAVPKDIFADIQEFFAIFVDRCHHGKEDASIFPRLADTDAADLVRRLEDEHATGRRLAAAYGAAMRAYVPGDAASGGRLATASRDYAAFLRDHIELEDTGLFPAIERELAGQDQALVAEFDRIETEEIGPGTHDRLHGMIDGLAARISPWDQSAP